MSYGYVLGRNLVIGKEYILRDSFVKLERVIHGTAVVLDRFDRRYECEAAELQEKPTPDELKHMEAAVKRNKPKLTKKEQKRAARLKCVVFLTDNPDVKKFFRIVPRTPGHRPIYKNILGYRARSQS